MIPSMHLKRFITLGIISKNALVLEPNAIYVTMPEINYDIEIFYLDLTGHVLSSCADHGFDFSDPVFWKR